MTFQLSPMSRCNGESLKAGARTGLAGTSQPLWGPLAIQRHSPPTFQTKMGRLREIHLSAHIYVCAHSHTKSRGNVPLLALRWPRGRTRSHCKSLPPPTRLCFGFGTFLILVLLSVGGDTDAVGGVCECRGDTSFWSRRWSLQWW
jgi:hypothetical protein